MSFCSLDREETPAWSHKRLKITSASEARAHLLPANIWEGEPATCVTPVQQQYFLSGGQTELARNMTGVIKHLKPACTRDCGTTFGSLTSGNVELVRVWMVQVQVWFYFQRTSRAHGGEVMHLSSGSVHMCSLFSWKSNTTSR